MEAADDKARLKELRTIAKEHGYKLLKARRGSIIEQVNPNSREPFYRLVGPDGDSTEGSLDALKEHLDLERKGATLEVTTACGRPIGTIRLGVKSWLEDEQR
jgi:hypothetical protein